MVYLLNLSNFRKVFKNRSETNENGNMILRLHVLQTHVQIECHQKIQKQVVLAALKSYFLFVFQVYCIYFYINFIRKRKEKSMHCMPNHLSYNFRALLFHYVCLLYY